MPPSWPGRSEVALLILCAVVLAWQLLLPGFIGLASNGDFPKVAGRLCLGAEDRGADNFLYFQPHYIRGQEFCWNPHIPSSEIALAWTADLIAGRPERFDIRWLGALHICIFLVFYWILLVAIRGLPGRIVLALLAIWIFADTANASYLNSFYSDVPAILGGLGALFALRAGMSRPWVLAFGAFALLFVTSKGQHGVFGWVLALLVVSLARDRLIASVTAAVILAGSGWVLFGTPRWYTAQARFNLIFFRIAKLSDAPLQALSELGLDASYLRYVGTHSFMPGTPTENEAWMQEFTNRTSYTAVLKYYLRHPGIALSFLKHDLETETAGRRAFNLSNFPRSYGMSAGAKSYRFATWTDVRSWLFDMWPWHIVLWYGVALGFVLKRREWLLGAVCLIAIGEFGLASLADTLETHRHLLMFHVLTDITVFQFVMSCVRLSSRMGM